MREHSVSLPWSGHRPLFFFLLLLVGPVGASEDVSRASASLGPALLVFCSVFFQQPLQVQSRMGRSGTNWSFVGFFCLYE